MADSNISRRAFVGAAAGMSALAAVGCAPQGEPRLEEGGEEKTLADTHAAAQAEDLEQFHVKVGYNCNGCFLAGYKRDGKIVRIEPGDRPNNSEKNNGCGRCMAFATKVQNEDARVMYPMRRTGERGSGEFERISWDEAIDEVAG